MAKTSMIVKNRNKKKAVMHRLALGLKPKPGTSTKVYNICSMCGRSHGYMRKYDICRICFRELAQKGELMGITKSSW